LLAGCGPLPQFGDLFGRQCFLTAPVGSALLGERDAFALPLADQGALEFGERPHDRQHQVRHRRILAGEGQTLLDELDAHAAFGQLLHKAAQIIEVARQPIHAVHHHGVAFAHEGQQRIEFRPLGVLARRLVGEHPADFDMLQLPFRVLVEAADPDIADALTLQGASKCENVRKKSMTFRRRCQETKKLTLF